MGSSSKNQMALKLNLLPITTTIREMCQSEGSFLPIFSLSTFKCQGEDVGADPEIRSGYLPE